HVFRHVVQGDAPCMNDTATVSITLHRRPDAGYSTAPVLCATNGPIVSLLGLLGGTPDNNGSWAFHPPSGAPVPHGPTFNPAAAPAGAYAYTVSAFAPCANSTATVQITLAPAPDAGLLGALSVCVSEDAVSLFSGLQGTPQGGGVWTDLDGTGQLNNGVLDATGLAPGLYAFLYTVPGTVPCPADTATVFVTVTAELDAGEDADVTLCTSEFVSLLQFLDGTPQPGGTLTGLES